MKTDLINIFNRLTSDELADYNLFDDILENHYEKIKYLYSLLDGISLKKIDRIYCKSKKNNIRVVIEPEKISDTNSIIFKLNKNKNNYTFSDHFNLNIIKSNGSIFIEISIKNDIKEDDIYASRSF